MEISLKLFEYNKAKKRILLASEYVGMPREFTVVSHHTGRKVKFTPITEEHPEFDEDGWDGEQMVYRPTEYIPGVQTCVIYNQS